MIRGRNALAITCHPEANAGGKGDKDDGKKGKAGGDRDGDKDDVKKESIVDATFSPDSAIIVEATGVVVDGFTVQGGINGNASGVDLKGTGGGLPPGSDSSRSKVLNNIIQKNQTGLSINSEGFGPPSRIDVERNSFRNNNAGVPASSCDGIFTSGMQGKHFVATGLPGVNLDNRDAAVTRPLAPVSPR